MSWIGYCAIGVLVISLVWTVVLGFVAMEDKWRKKK